MLGNARKIWRCFEYETYIAKRSIPIICIHHATLSIIIKLEEQAKLDTLVLLAQKKQIDLLKSRDEMNEKMVELVKPKWYENTYVWLLAGFILGKI